MEFILEFILGVMEGCWKVFEQKNTMIWFTFPKEFTGSYLEESLGGERRRMDIN